MHHLGFLIGPVGNPNPQKLYFTLWRDREPHQLGYACFQGDTGTRIAEVRKLFADLQTPSVSRLTVFQFLQECQRRLVHLLFALSFSKQPRQLGERRLGAD